MTKRLLLLLILPLCCAAQDKPTLNDSLAARLRKDSLRIYRNTLAKPFLKIENRNSFLFNHPVDFYGLMLGATFWNRHTLAMGYYLLDEKSKQPVPARDKAGKTQQFLHFNYFNFTYQYVLLSKRFVQINLPLEIGVGTYYARTVDSSASVSSWHSNGRVIPFGGGVQVVGKILKWLGVSGTGGYRYVRSKESLLQFNGPYYSYGVWVDVRQLLRDFRYYHARKKYRKQQSALIAK